MKKTWTGCKAKESFALGMIFLRLQKFFLVGKEFPNTIKDGCNESGRKGKMRNPTNYRPSAVWLLMVLQFLLGFGALVSGTLLVVAPNGSLMQMPLSMLQYSPFENFLIPGIILSTLLGIYPLALTYGLWQKPVWSWPEAINPFKQFHWCWAASLAAGTILLIWITVQVLMLQTIAFLHVLYFIWGWVLILLTLTPATRRHYWRG
jgi:hypothetical protein